MKKNEKNEGLQSRREFFKKAAKGALPILGLAIIANVPMISNAVESEFCACSSDCKGACSGGCSATCYNQCYASCKTGCQYSCRSTCDASCNGR